MYIFFHTLLFPIIIRVGEIVDWIPHKVYVCVFNSHDIKEFIRRKKPTITPPPTKIGEEDEKIREKIQSLQKHTHKRLEGKQKS